MMHIWSMGHSQWPCGLRHGSEPSTSKIVDLNPTGGMEFCLL